MFSGLMAKVIAGAVIFLLLGGSGIYAVSKIKGCVRAEDKAATLEKTVEKTQAVKEADEKSEQDLEEMTNEEILEYSHTGVLPERLRHRAAP